MQSADPPFIGDWLREKKLGAGGFGVVTLWRNTKTNQRIAVKQCHPPVSGATAAHADDVRRRWHLEVDYMTAKVSHPSIVRGVRVEPASFLADLERLQPAAHPMPVLLMEYCEGGDLRRLLNTSDYATGFPEHEARAVLRSLGAAIEYLHTLKITHRDIKPENIVCKTDEQTGCKQYKLTDLGYAKRLDHQTLVASLVGTLEYIAPELCLTDRYTNTVDYWSLGVIAYELCTGVRPFVPHLPLARWMMVVKKKLSVHIAISEDQPEESIRYETELPREHRLSSALADLLVPWLRIALEWNPKQRGHVFKPPPAHAPQAEPQSGPANQLPPTLELRIFTQLRDLLDRRILRVFCLHTHRPYSVELGARFGTLAALIDWLCEVTKITRHEINLFLPFAHPLEAPLSLATRPTDLWWPQAAEAGTMLYVNRMGKMPDPRRRTPTPMAAESAIAVEMELPEVVKEVVAQPTAKWRPHVVRRFGTAAFHACRREQQLYREALGGWHSLVLRLDHEVQLARSVVDRLMRGVAQLEGRVRMVAETREQVVEQAAAGVEQGEEMARVCRELARLEKHIAQTVVASESIAKRYASVQRRSQESKQWRILERREAGVGGDLFGLERMGKALEILQIKLQQKAAVELQVREMVQIVESCQRRRAELLGEKEWLLLQEISAMAFEISEIKKTIEKATECIAEYQPQVSALNSALLKIADSHAKEKYSHATPAAFLPVIDGIGSGNSNETHPGASAQAVPVNGMTSASSTTSLTTVVRAPLKSLPQIKLALSEVPASTLVAQNQAILSKMDKLIREINAELIFDD